MEYKTLQKKESLPDFLETTKYDNLPTKVSLLFDETPLEKIANYTSKTSVYLGSVNAVYKADDKDNDKDGNNNNSNGQKGGCGGGKGGGCGGGQGGCGKGNGNSGGCGKGSGKGKP